MSRLTAQLDGKPVYLYSFVQGAYEDRREYLYAHAEKLSRAEIIARLRAALKTLPERIEIDFSAPPVPDLFERACTLAGFVEVGDMIPTELWLGRIGRPSTERDWLERALDRFEKESP